VIAFVTLGAAAQLAALQQPSAAATYMVAGAVLWTGIRIAGWRAARTMSLDYGSSADESWLQTLNLSEALD